MDTGTDGRSASSRAEADGRSASSRAEEDELLDQAWALAPGVALRPEPFGALAYHFGNRRLTFLKRPELVEAVRALESSSTVRSALTAARVPAAQFPAYLAALRGLAAADMIRPRNPT